MPRWLRHSERTDRDRQQRDLNQNLTAPSRYPQDRDASTSTSRSPARPSSSASGRDTGRRAEDTLGVQTLWPLASQGADAVAKTTIDIVAIHGLGGHPYDTWEEDGRLWLRDFLPNDASDAHVMSFGYNSSWAFSGSVSRIDDFARSFLEGLVARRRRAKTSRNPLVVVCHSLGGIVFKKALIIAHEREDLYKDLLTPVKGVMFMGTPHRGSDFGYWGKILGKIANVGLPTIRTELLRDLETKSAVLGEICTQFVRRAVPLRIITVYERRKITGLPELIVDKDSAVLNLPNERITPVEADHIAMCKFRSDSGSRYETTIGYVLELVEFAKGNVEQMYHVAKEHLLSMLQGQRFKQGKILPRIERPHRDTCEWFFRGWNHQDWLRKPTCKLLWVHGPPGAGKSVLSKELFLRLASNDTRLQAVQEYETMSPVITLCFFFSRQENGRRTMDSLVHELFCQLLELYDTLVASVPRHFRANHIPRREDLIAAFQDLLTRDTGPFIRLVLDGLDETIDDDAAAISQFVEQLVCSDVFDRLKIYISDRRPPLEPLQSLPSYEVRVVEVKGPEVYGKVQTFVSETVQPKLSAASIPRTLTRDVIEDLTDIADGNFLHAKLATAFFFQGTTLWTRTTVEERLQAVKRLTPTLESFYCGLLRLIPKGMVQTAKIVFSMIRCAAAPVNVEMLQLAVTIDPQHRTISAIMDDVPYNLSDSLQHHFGNLLSVEKGTVRFYHKSASDLFIEPPKQEENIEMLARFSSTEADCHQFICKICLVALRLDDVRTAISTGALPPASDLCNALGFNRAGQRRDAVVLSQDRQRNAQRLWRYIQDIRFPLLHYALAYWDIHYASCQNDETVNGLLLGWLQSVEARYMFLWRGNLLFDPEPHGAQSKDVGHSWVRSADFVDISPKYGIPALFLLLEYGDFDHAVSISYHDPNAVWSERTLLSTAIANGRFKVARLLLDRADSDLTQPRGWLDPQRLHRSRSDPTMRSKYPRAELSEYDKAIHYAFTDRVLASAGSPALLSQLVRSAGADINVRGYKGETALSLFLNSSESSVSQHFDVWRALLEHPEIDLNPLNAKGQPILRVLNKNRHHAHFASELFARHLEQGLSSIYTPQTLINFEALGWHELETELVRRLPHIATTVMERGFTILTHYAFMGRKEQVMCYLRNLPSDAASSLDNGTESLINMCADQDWEDAVQLLRSKFGAEPTLSDHKGRSILHWAVENEWSLDREEYDNFSTAMLDLKDRDSKTALHIAAEISNVKAARWLLKRGASFTLRDKYGRSAVHVAAWVFCSRIIDLFLDSDMREFGRDLTGRGFLHYLAMWADRDYVCEAVRRKRMLLDIRDRRRRTPLHYAALTSNCEATVALLSLGCSVNSRDSNGWTALHYALRNSNDQLVSILVEYQADWSPVNGFGQSCLQLSIRAGNLDHARLAQSHCPTDPARRDKFGRTSFHDLCVTLTSIMNKYDHIDGDNGAIQRVIFRKVLGTDAPLGRLAAIPDCHGYSPLHIAVFVGNVDLAATLLGSLQVDDSPTDDSHCAPLDWASAKRDYHMIDLLRKYGARCMADEGGRAVLLSYWSARSQLDPDAGPDFEPESWALVSRHNRAHQFIKRLEDGRPSAERRVVDLATRDLCYEINAIESQLESPGRAFNDDEGPMTDLEESVLQYELKRRKDHLADLKADQSAEFVP